MATGRHTISHAKNLFHGNAQYTPHESGKRGLPMYPIFRYSFDAPATADANALVTKVAITSGATTALTLASTVTGAGLSGGIKTLDVPRNVTITASDLTIGSGTISFIIKGTDTYGATMWERMKVTASDATVSGKKAFKTITAIDSVVSSVTGVFYIGFGNRFGLPYKLEDPHDVVQAHSGTNAVATDFSPSDLVLPTYTATETHSATIGVTGFAGLPRDVRGTWKPPDTADAALNFSIWYRINDPDSKHGAFGIDQAAT